VFMDRLSAFGLWLSAPRFFLALIASSNHPIHFIPVRELKADS